MVVPVTGGVLLAVDINSPLECTKSGGFCFCFCFSASASCSIPHVSAFVILSFVQRFRSPFQRVLKAGSSGASGFWAVFTIFLLFGGHYMTEMGSLSAFLILGVQVQGMVCGG